MAVTLTLIGKTPGNTQFGLDTFTEHYKCDATADVVLTDAGVPQMASVHPDYAFMFVTARYVSETSETASALDLVYTGCLLDDGDGPLLPPQQAGFANPVQSATSSFATTGVAISSPITVQFFAAQNRLSYTSYLAKGTDEAAVPSEDPTIQYVTFSGIALQGIGSDNIVHTAFSIDSVSTIDSQEIVTGKFWSNTASTTKMFVPATLQVNSSGVYVGLVANGTGYTVGDSLTFTGGSGAATVTVTAVLPGGGVAGWTVTSNTFTTAESAMTASGGTGSGCQAVAIVI